MLINGISYAKVRTIQSRRAFEQCLAKDSMVVALFYNQNDKGLLRMYDDVSAYQMYDDADVVFLKINAARKELQDLANLYGVTALPAFIFFNKGQRVNGVLSGTVSRDVLQAHINKYYGAEMQVYVANKDARKEQRFSQENENWKLYFYPRDMVVPSYGPEERMLE